MSRRSIKDKKERNVKKKKTHRRVSSETPTARVTKKMNAPRKDSVRAMTDICSYGCEYSEKIALQKGTSEQGYYLYDSKNIELSPEDAFEIFVHHNYSSQRTLNEGWARELAHNMVTAVSIDIVVGPGGKAFVVNGQHTLWAIYLRQRTTSAPFNIYQARDEQAIADLYAIFDSNKTRTIQQVLHASKNSNALIYDGPVPKLAKWSQCAALAENDFTRKDMSKRGNSNKVAFAKREDVQEFAKWMDDHVIESHHSKLVPQAVGAAFYAMFKSDFPNAEKFACGYFRGVGLDEGSAILIMRNRMASRPKHLHAASAGYELVQLMYSSWRKFCMNETLTNLRKTLDIPAYDKWKIYEISRKTITLAGANVRVSVQRK